MINPEPQAESLGVMPNISTPPELHEAETPDVIEVTISEVDRQTAERYCHIEECLIATALKNRGYNVIWVSPRAARTDRSENLYFFDQLSLGSEWQCNRSAVDYNHRTEKPFYGPEVVGLKLRLVRGEPSPQSTPNNAAAGKE